MWRGRAADCERRAGCWRFGNRGCHWRYGCLVSLGHCETLNQRIRREASGLYSQPQPTRHPSRTIRRPCGIGAASTWRELTSARHQIGGVRFLRLWSPCVHAGILTKLKTLGIVGIPRVSNGADDGSRTLYSPLTPCAFNTRKLEIPAFYGHRRRLRSCCFSEGVTSVLPQSFGDFPSDSVGNGVQIFVEEIGVSVEGHRRALMPEHSLESLHVGSRMHRDACRRVP